MKTAAVFFILLWHHHCFATNPSSGPGWTYDVYPWGKKTSLAERQGQLLQVMHEHLELHVHEEFTDKYLSFIPATRRYVRQMEGVKYHIELEGEQRRASSIVKSLSSSESLGGGDALVPVVGDAYINDIHRNQDLLARHLSGACITMPAQYWTYEVCHKIEVRQAHMEFLHGGKVRRDPDWSLGHYTGTKIVRQNGDSSDKTSPIIQMTDFYAEGQRCDETDQGRSVEVEMQCCANLPGAHEAEQQHRRTHGAHTHTQHTQHRKHGQAARDNNNKYYDNVQHEVNSFILSVSEPSVCAYKMTVCVPAMCFPNPPTSLPAAAAAAAGPHSQAGSSAGSASLAPLNILADPHSQLDLVTIMRALNATCLHRQVDWWTYELCYAKGIRQFHLALENVRADNGGFMQRQTVQAQFSLGVVQNPTAVYSNATKLHEMAGLPPPPQPSVAPGDPKEPLLAMQKNLKSRQAHGKTHPSKTPSGDSREKKAKRGRHETGDASMHATTSVDGESSDINHHQTTMLSQKNPGDNNEIRDSIVLPVVPEATAPQVPSRMDAIPSPGLPNSMFRTSTHSPAALKMELTGGTECDLEAVERATTVELVCHDKEEILEIVEDRTCHYSMRVGSALLCRHPAFVPLQSKVRRLLFVAEDVDEMKTPQGTSPKAIEAA